MRRNQLKKLANFLANDVKDDWFDLGNWGTYGFTKKRCGSTACALGWATACFPRSRLKLWRDEKDDTRSALDIRYTDNNGTTWDGYDAAEAFFKIGISDARYLFAPDEYGNDRSRFAVCERLIEVANRGQT